MGTDYGHADTSSELEALQLLKEIPGVTGPVAEKILGDNAKALYALQVWVGVVMVRQAHHERNSAGPTASGNTSGQDEL